MLTIVALWQYQKKKGTQQLGAEYVTTCLILVKANDFTKIIWIVRALFASYLHLIVYLCSLLWLNSKPSLALRPHKMWTQSAITALYKYSLQDHFKTEFNCIWKAMKYLQEMGVWYDYCLQVSWALGTTWCHRFSYWSGFFYMGFTAFRCKLVEGLVKVFP